MVNPIVSLMTEPIFTLLDLNTWKRREIFYYFSKMAPTGYSISVEVDVTALHQTLKQAKKKFFPAYLWLVTKCLAEQQEFMVAEVGGVLGAFDHLTPLYAAFHEDYKIFSAFHEAYLEDQRLYGANHGILAKKDTLPPVNSYTVSCIPWVEFQHFSVYSYENKPYYFPSVEAGKFYEKEGKLLLPLSLTCHHATTDGYHIKEFLRSSQNYADHFEQFLS